MFRTGEGEQQHRLLSEDELRHIARDVHNITRNGAYQGDSCKGSSSSHTLDGVFAVAESRTITAVHRVAAWNALSAVVDHFRDQPFSSAALPDNVWKRAFELYLDHSCNARPKSSKQLLSSLSAALRRTNHRSTLRQYAARLLIECIQYVSNLQVAKFALQALAQFLGKQALSLNEVVCHLNTASLELCQRDVQSLIHMVLHWVAEGDFGSVVAHVISVILGSLDISELASENPLEAHLAHDPLWMQPLEDVMKLDSVTVDDLRAHIFPVLFKRDFHEYARFLDRQGFRLMHDTTDSTHTTTTRCHPQNHDLLYAALQAGKELGLLYETEDLVVSQTSSAILLPIHHIQLLLSHQSRQARLTGLSLLITSHSVTTPLPLKTLHALKRSLHVFFTDADANFRSELFSLMQKLVDRFRAITAVLGRKTNSSRTNGDVMADIFTSFNAHRSFLQWLLSFLHAELRPTASYQRHISALKALAIISRSGLDRTVAFGRLSKSAVAETKWPFHLPIMSSGLRRLLLDLLLNPFDDVRQTSALILDLYIAANGEESTAATCTKLQATIARAEQVMLLTGRADHADGVARLYASLYRQCPDSLRPGATRDQHSKSTVFAHLLNESQRMIEIAKRDIKTAVSQYPMHGLLSSFRYILSEQYSSPELQQFTERLAACLHIIWDVVHPVLCDDAPEGYLPEQCKEVSDVSSKDTLSYCWRALKESNLLLGTMVSNLPLDEQILRILSELCFRQLAELRHRGAFSTVAQTWILCCTQCRKFTANTGEGLLQVWYDEILHLLRSRTTINTRRSAGIPALLCGLLIADKSEQLLPQAFQGLTDIAKQPVDDFASQAGSLAQVHALNCIKDILKNTRLGEQSEQYVPAALRLAAESIRSEVWAVRNCGLMLFRAVIDRLFGTSEAHLETSGPTYSKFSIHHYPELLNVILDLLKSPQIATSEGVFPALQFVQHMDIPDDARSKTMRAVLPLTTSKSWHIRDKAAQTYAQIIAHDDIVTSIDQQVHALYAEGQKQNALHGTLLCIKHSIRRLRERQASHGDSRSHTESNERNAQNRSPLSWLSAFYAASGEYNNNQCMFTKAAHIDVIAECIRYVHQDPENALQLPTPMAPRQDQVDIWMEITRVLDRSGSGANEHVLRSALARTYVYELFSVERHLFSGDHPPPFPLAFDKLFSELARWDADACRIFLTTCLELELQSSSAIMLCICCLIILDGAQNLIENVDITLKCEAQRLLLALIGKVSSHEMNVSVLNPHLLRHLKDSWAPCSTDSNDEYADQWLQLQAVVLDRFIGRELEGEVQESLKSALLSFMGHCCDAIGGRGLFGREAAALAISLLKNSWSYIIRMQEQSFLDLCFGIHELLVDDDEDIRSLASRSAAFIVNIPANRPHKVVLEPLSTAEKLAQWMLKRWANDSHFIIHIARRAFGVCHSQCVSVADQMSELGTTDSALFAEERQNLYIDDAREVRFWSRVLMRVDVKSVPKSLACRLCKWVSEGLDILIATAEKERDGALGWTSKAAMFTLGLQVIYGVEILLHLVEQGARIPVRPSTLRIKLGKFGMAAYASEVSALWLREIDRVMAAAIMSTIRSCKAVTEEIQRRKGSQFPVSADTPKMSQSIE